MGVVSSFCFPWEVSKRHIDQYFPAFIGHKVGFYRKRCYCTVVLKAMTEICTAEKDMRLNILKRNKTAFSTKVQVTW